MAALVIFTMKRNAAFSWKRSHQSKMSAKKEYGC